VIQTDTRAVPENFRLGLVVNPLAGLGGPAGLKGSDHAMTSAWAAERGVASKVNDRVVAVFEGLAALGHSPVIVTASGAMGQQACNVFAGELKFETVYQAGEQTSGDDTTAAVRAIQGAQVDLLLFAGGDGTARDVCRGIRHDQAVLGIPAGVKMHSGVFAVTPKAVVSVIDSLIRHRLVAACTAEVRDIDEEAFAKGRVETRYFGEMLIPDDQLLVQSVKCSGMLDDELMLDELAAYMVDTVEDDTLYVLGSGGTLHRIKQGLGMDDPTLLGVDVICNGQVIARDAHEQQLFELVERYPDCRILLSVIGGQGVVLGRGNQQISPRVLEAIGLENLRFVATQSKLRALNGRPLRVDSGSDALDRALAGFHKVQTGYEDAVFYEVRYLGD